ncbi:TolA protein [Myxococcus hansupus]|uniref:TolA protein n=2 Tax=Pseudomyxococcus hansupus TaxID=1297742 RepID=A0A0H4WV28_9BACT|nr:TolA protein [Myxococcus hansupus]
MYLGVAGTALLLLGGCASQQRSSAKVDKEWVARVPSEQLGDVRQAQLAEDQAREQIPRARVAAQDAEQALEVARRNEAAAKSRHEADELAKKSAQEKGDLAAIEQARGAACESQHALTLAQAETAWRRDAVDTLKSLEVVRERELDVASAQLRQTQYEAVNANEDVRAQDLSAGDFSSAVADARRKAADQQRQADARLQREEQAKAHWEQLRDQGYGGSGSQQDK